MHSTELVNLSSKSAFCFIRCLKILSNISILFSAQNYHHFHNFLFREIWYYMWTKLSPYIVEMAYHWRSDYNGSFFSAERCGQGFQLDVRLETLLCVSSWLIYSLCPRSSSWQTADVTVYNFTKNAQLEVWTFRVTGPIRKCCSCWYREQYTYYSEQYQPRGFRWNY